MFGVIDVYIPTCFAVSYAVFSWLGLHEEMKLDMQRIWKRNLGRDDRCIADNGKEVLLTSWTKTISYIDWSHVATI